MFKFHKIRVILFIISTIVFILGSQIYGFDLASEIENSFQNIYKNGFSDDYLNMPYSSSFSKDPYGDELKNTEDMETQLQLAGVDMVEQALIEDNCPMSKKKIRGILYYYVPEFRNDIIRTLKMEKGDTDSNKFILDREKVIDYCIEYYKCEMRDSIKYNDNEIRRSTSKDVETNCKEFFQKKYIEGQNNESRNQSIEISQLGSDKYRNATTEDSPYDIMSDFGVIGKLLFEGSQDPVQPVFYNLPMFRNAHKAVKDYKDSEKNNPDKGIDGNLKNPENPENSENSENPENPEDPEDPENPKDLKNPDDLDFLGKKASVFDEYDSLIEGLGVSNVNIDNALFRGKICNDDSEGEIEGKEEGEIEGEEIGESGTKGDLGKKQPDYDPSREDDDNLQTSSTTASDEDFNHYMNYLQSLVDSYTDNVDNKNQAEKTIEEIKKCMEGCNGLRVDQKMSCRMMCACGEIDSSPIFDPEKTNGLGPIFKIRFCTVPAENLKFSVGGKRIMSIEEGINEIYGVVDKLSREGKLGVRTQQYNFLDSTTKKMNIANSFAFSIDIEWVDIANKLPNYSKEYREYVAKKNKDKWEKEYGIQNPLNDPSTKNIYGMIANNNPVANDISSVLSSEISKEKKNTVEKATSLVDPNEDSNASRYTSLSNSLDVLLFQQYNFWTDVSSYTQDFYDYAVTLYGKKAKS